MSLVTIDLEIVRVLTHAANTIMENQLEWQLLAANSEWKPQYNYLLEVRC